MVKAKKAEWALGREITCPSESVNSRHVQCRWSTKLVIGKLFLPTGATADQILALWQGLSGVARLKLAQFAAGVLGLTQAQIDFPLAAEHHRARYSK